MSLNGYQYHSYLLNDKLHFSPTSLYGAQKPRMAPFSKPKNNLVRNMIIVIGIVSHLHNLLWVWNNYYDKFQLYNILVILIGKR